MAITLFTISEYHPVTPSTSFEAVAAQTDSVAAPAGIDEKGGPAVALTAPTESAAVETAANEPTQAVVPSVSRSEQAAVAATPLGTASHVAMVNSELSSANYVAELAAAQPADSALDQMLGHPLRNVENSSARGEPLAQISVPGESRLYRLLGGSARLASTNSGDSALRMNAQAARHLTERRLEESDVVSRLAVAGNQVRIKF